MFVEENVVREKRGAFTLIELSIVLVIISLIVGGVIGGKSLIQATKIQGVIAEMDALRTAWHTFSLQYDAMPGDMRDAEDYWSASWIENGDGNQKNQWTSEGAPASEPVNAFEHLIASEILTGPQGNLLINVSDDVRYGSSKFEGTNYRFQYMSSVTIRGNVIVLAKNQTGVSTLFSIFSAREMKRMDDKVDDGMPRMGKFVVSSGQEVDAPGCYDNATTYNIDETVVACYPIASVGH